MTFEPNNILDRLKNILLLHGAIGSKAQFDSLKKLLQTDFEVHAINFSGHGGEAFTADFSIEKFTEEVHLYIGQNNLSPVHIFGYSMGGYVAMNLAHRQPLLVKTVITLATKFIWNEDIAAKEIKMLDADRIEVKLAAFAAELSQRHAPNNWKDVVIKTKHMLTSLGYKNALKDEDYTKIETPTLVMLGDRDKMVTMDETVAVYQSLPNAQLAILPATAHPLEQVDAEQLYFQIRSFIKNNSI